MFTVDKIQSLNELELTVYEYVIQHKTAIPYMRILELAREVHVSTTTVLRFCKKLRCSVITITNNEQSTAAQLSDLNISYYISMRRGELMVDYTSQVPAVYLVECLAKKVRNRLTENK